MSDTCRHGRAFDCVRCAQEELRKVKGELDRIAAAIDYPEDWDTAAYPTISDAIVEIVECAKCVLAAAAIRAPKGSGLRNMGECPNRLRARHGNRVGGFEP